MAQRVFEQKASKVSKVFVQCLRGNALAITGYEVAQAGGFRANANSLSPLRPSVRKSLGSRPTRVIGGPNLGFRKANFAKASAVAKAIADKSSAKGAETDFKQKLAKAST
jgi:hypothetical protein